MSITSRISKKTFFAAAALGLAAVVPAHAYLYEDKITGWTEIDGVYKANDYYVYKIDNTSLFTSEWTSYDNLPWVTFVKTGSGTVQMDLGAPGSLYNQHAFGFTDDNNSSNDGATYTQIRDRNGVLGAAEVEYHSASPIWNLLNSWKSGEVVVDQGTLSLGGFVNAWYDFGSIINNSQIKQSTGKMIGASRITVRKGAVLDISKNNSFISETWSSGKGMAMNDSLTTFQFLNNLQAGDYGTDVDTALVLGTSTAYHVNLNVGAWEDNTRKDTTQGGGFRTAYFDTELAFGGSIGRISGAGNIYKTGAGALTLLSSSQEFTGSLYAAGGSLVIAGNDSSGKTKSFKDAFGNNVLVHVSSAVANAASVNVVGTMNDGKESNGGSMQGSNIGGYIGYTILEKENPENKEERVIITAVKEAFFTTPDAGTLVVAENQSIRNLQSYFNAGLAVNAGTSATDAVLLAANNDGMLAPKDSTVTDRGTGDAPIIAGTGIGSKIVIPGGNYTVSGGKYVLNTDRNGYMQGGVLVINQEVGKGGVYQGSIVGARVSIYNKKTFADETAARVEEEVLNNAARLKNALVLSDRIKADVGLTDQEVASLNIAADGSFALDNPVAWKVVNYYKQTNLGTPYYIDYKADETVTGGLLVLEGAGDLALLLETANYSGIYIDENRTGKTVLNVSAVNSLKGSAVSLGGRGLVSFVATQGSTLNVKLNGFKQGSQLVFATADTIETIGGTVRVGDIRQAEIGFSQVQDGIYGDIYVESGIGLNLTGNESVFSNADSVTLWKGNAWKDENAAPTLTLYKKGDVFASQLLNDLTGDSTASIVLGTGVLTTVISDNNVDAYSGLTHGSYAGQISGAGSVIKGGAGTFTLSGGERNRNFTGTLEIAEGSLALTRNDSLTGASALILNAGTKATMSGDQKLRTLYGAAGTSLSVEKTLTLGANVTPASGEDRALVTNNLGLSVAANVYNSDSTAASFARFKNCFDLEGNLVLANNAVGVFANQKAATVGYLTAASKLAYSGFDTSVLEKFVGVKNYDGNDLLSQGDYDNLKAFAANGGTGTPVAGVAQASLLSDLADKYALLVEANNYLNLFAPTGTVDGFAWYSPKALESLFATKAEYNVYVREILAQEVAAEYGSAIPENPTTAEKKAINEALFTVLCEKYEELSVRNLNAQLKANPEKMFAVFKTAKNLAGTPMMSEAEIAALDETIASGTDIEIQNAYAVWSAKYEAIQNKKLFAGIAVPGAFAAQVDVNGALTDTSWISNPAFAGAIVADKLVKTGNNAVDLTGALTANAIVIEDGELGIEGTALTGTVSGGISVSRNATLSVNVNANTNLAEGEEDPGVVFNEAVSGDGDFVKTGAGKLVLGSNVLYTGTTEIEGGTLVLALRETTTKMVNGTSKTILPQSHIYFTGNNTALVLSQSEDVVWTGNIQAKNGVAGAELTKLGEATLTIGGNVALGENAGISVKEGVLNLSDISFHANTGINIAKGAALSLGKSSVGGSVSFAGEGALRVSGELSLSGATAAANADAFVGAVSVLNGGKLTLAGESVFANASVVMVNTGANLVVSNSSTQKIQALAGAGTLTLSSSSVLVLNNSGERIGMSKPAGVYTFNEDTLLSVPDFSGSVTGTGTLKVVGSGVSSFSGDVSAPVSVLDGGQVVLNAAKFDKQSGATVTVEGKDSEVIFLVSGAGTANLDVGSVAFTGTEGAFGKAGNGTLSASQYDFVNSKNVFVYDGVLTVDGWVSAKKTIASGAKLSMSIGDTEPDFSTVYGSGTLELTSAKDVTLSPDKVNVVATTEGFFNGEIRFAGSGYNVTLAAGTSAQMVAVSTEVGVGLTVSDNVTFIQSQNSEIAGTLEVSGTVSVQGLDTKKGNSGRVLSSDFRSLTVSGDFVSQSGSEFKMSNIGFGFRSTEADMAVYIDADSVANTFIVDYVDETQKTLVATGTKIDLDTKPNAPAESKLKELSVIKSGDKTFTLSAGTIANELGSGNMLRDSVFGISKDVYTTLADNGGVLNLGVNEGTMVLTLTDTSEKLTTSNGVNVELVTLRSATAATAGTLSVQSTIPQRRALEANAQIFAETIRGGGNVSFDGRVGSGLVVAAKQEYLGQTTISGNVEFSGEGRKNASSLLTVTDGATLHGGVNLTGRKVDYSVSAVRNADDTGAPGSATLTLTLSDARLASPIKAQVKIAANGALDTSSWEILGATPVGVSVDPASVTFKDGVLSLTATDAAFNGESYSISVETGMLPSTVGGTDSKQGTAIVAGNVALNTGSKVVLDAMAGDRISVGSGTVTIGANSSIYVENLGVEAVGKTLTLVRAGTVTGTKPSGTKTSGTAAVVAALDSANRNLAAGEKEMKLAVYTDTNGDICAKMLVDDFAALGADYNEGVSESFLSALSEISSWDGRTIVNADGIPPSKGKDLFFALNSLPSSSLEDEVAKLSPISFAAMLAMPVAAFNSDIARIHSRLDQRRYDGAEPLRDSGEYEFFALAQSDFAENASVSDAPNFDYNLYGVTAGFDWKPNYETTLGLALGYTYGKAKIHNSGGKINMDDMRVTAFASRLFGNCYVDAGVQAGMATFDSRRQTFAGATSGDTDSIFAGTFITVGSVFVISQDKKNGSGLYFTPSAGLSYLHTKIDGFRETGTAGLVMDDAEGDSLRARIAAAVQWSFPLDNWQMRLGLEVAYSHDFLGEELDMDGRFAAGGSKFSASGKALPTDIFSFGPTVDILVSERSSIYFGYGIDVDTDSGISQNVNAGFRHRF